jgi:hypothetical protein
MKMTDKELDEIESLADIMSAEAPIVHRLLRVCYHGILLKKLIVEVRRLKGQNESPKGTHLYIVPDLPECS